MRLTTRGFQPKLVKPAHLRIGDTIRVTLPEYYGLTRIYEGTIGDRQHNGVTTGYFTHKGAMLLTTIEGKTRARITLLKPAADLEQIGLW